MSFLEFLVGGLALMVLVLGYLYHGASSANRVLVGDNAKLEEAKRKVDELIKKRTSSEAEIMFIGLLVTMNDRFMSAHYKKDRAAALNERAILIDALEFQGFELEKYSSNITIRKEDVVNRLGEDYNKLISTNALDRYVSC